MKILLAALILAVPAAAVDFDGGVDVSAVLGEARAAAATSDYLELKRPPASYRPDEFDHSWECKDVVFDSEDTIQCLTTPCLVSKAARLQSYHLGNCKSYDGHRCVGGESTGFSHLGGAGVSLVDPKPLRPWEKDRFRLCMEGTMVDFSIKDASYEYVIEQAGTQENDWQWIVRQGAKKPTPADPDGVKAELLLGPYDEAKIEFSDEHAAHYGDERIEIRYWVKRKVNNWPDKVEFEGVFSGFVAASYRVERKPFSTRGHYLEDYYVEYQIRRLGTVSTPAWTKKRRGTTDGLVELF